MGFVVALGDFRVGNSHAMGNRRAADVNSLFIRQRYLLACLQRLQDTNFQAVHVFTESTFIVD